MKRLKKLFELPTEEQQKHDEQIEYLNSFVEMYRCRMCAKVFLRHRDQIYVTPNDDKAFWRPSDRSSTDARLHKCADGHHGMIEFVGLQKRRG